MYAVLQMSLEWRLCPIQVSWCYYPECTEPIIHSRVSRPSPSLCRPSACSLMTYRPLAGVRDQAAWIQALLQRSWDGLSPWGPPPGCPPPHGGSAPRGAHFPAPTAQHAPTEVLTTFCCAFQLLRLCIFALLPLLSGRFQPLPRPKPRLCQPPPIPTPLQGAVPETQVPTVPCPWLVVINAA